MFHNNYCACLLPLKETCNHPEETVSGSNACDAKVTFEDLGRELNRKEGFLGGDSGTQGYGGSLKVSSMAELFQRLLPDPLESTSNRIFLDAGCALGKPLFLALHYGFTRAFGFELDPNKCIKAITLRDRMLVWLRSRGIDWSREGDNLKVMCASVAHIPTLEPATHVYAAWQGWSFRDKKKLGKKFRRSATAEHIVLVERNIAPDLTKHKEFRKLGFGDVEQVGEKISVQMANGMTALSAYVLRKRASSANSAVSPNNILPDIEELTTHREETQVIKVSGFSAKAEKYYASCRVVAASAHADRRKLSCHQIKTLQNKAALGASCAHENANKAMKAAEGATGGAKFTTQRRAREAHMMAELASEIGRAHV